MNTHTQHVVAGVEEAIDKQMVRKLCSETPELSDLSQKEQAIAVGHLASLAMIADLREGIVREWAANVIIDAFEQVDWETVGKAILVDPEAN